MRCNLFREVWTSSNQFAVYMYINKTNPTRECSELTKITKCCSKMLIDNADLRVWILRHFKDQTSMWLRVLCRMNYIPPLSLLEGLNCCHRIHLRMRGLFYTKCWIFSEIKHIRRSELCGLLLKIDVWGSILKVLVIYEAHFCRIRYHWVPLKHL